MALKWKKPSSTSYYEAYANCGPFLAYVGPTSWGVDLVHTVSGCCDKAPKQKAHVSMAGGSGERIRYIKKTNKISYKHLGGDSMEARHKYYREQCEKWLETHAKSILKGVK